MKYYLDTNIIIYAINNKFPLIRDHFYNIPAQSIVIPSVVMAEIEYGARKSNDYEKTINVYKKFTDVFEKAEFNEKASAEYGIIRAALEKNGTPIGSNDLLIASIVKAENGILVTHNVGEFERVADLRFEDWTV